MRFFFGNQIHILWTSFACMCLWWCQGSDYSKIDLESNRRLLHSIVVFSSLKPIEIWMIHKHMETHELKMNKKIPKLKRPKKMAQSQHGDRNMYDVVWTFLRNQSHNCKWFTKLLLNWVITDKNGSFPMNLRTFFVCGHL